MSLGFKEKRDTVFSSMILSLFQLHTNTNTHAEKQQQLSSILFRGDETNLVVSFVHSSI